MGYFCIAWNLGVGAIGFADSCPVTLVGSNPCSLDREGRGFKAVLGKLLKRTHQVEFVSL